MFLILLTQLPTHRPPSLFVDARVAKQPRVGFSASSNSSFIDANVTHRARPPMQALERRSQRDRTPAPPTQRSADVTQLFSRQQEKFSSSTLVPCKLIHLTTIREDWNQRRQGRAGCTMPLLGFIRQTFHKTLCKWIILQSRIDAPCCLSYTIQPHVSTRTSSRSEEQQQIEIN